MGGLTVHSIVRNEPFIYYSIKSVYDFADVILLYDTGSTDHTLADIQQLLDEDRAKKIKFQEFPIIDETQWVKGTKSNWRRSIVRNRENLRAAGNNMRTLRQRQIDETETDFFLVLDGDEIYYRKTIRSIALHTVHDLPPDKVCGFVALDWFVDLAHKFRGASRGTAPSPVGRLFRKTGISIVGDFPHEYHYHNGQRITKWGPTSCYIARSTPALTHWETYLKPWRQTKIPDVLYGVKFAELPEVMVVNDYFIGRLEEGRYHEGV